jgi:hypothetical protein
MQFEFSDAEINTILAGLSELPVKTSLTLINQIMARYQKPAILTNGATMQPEIRQHETNQPAAS